MSTFGAAEGQHLVKRADYERLIREFGAEPMTEDLVSMFRRPHRFLRRGLVFAHRGFREYLGHWAKGEPVAIVSGRGPSNYMHLGHLALFEFVRWLQEELDAVVYIPLSDDEKYVFGKVRDLRDAYRFAIDNALDIAALGFKEGKTYFFVSTKYRPVYELSVRISRYLTYSTVRATFGLDESANAGVIFYAAVQAAHILLPTVERGLPVVVPIAMDQDPYMRLTRDVAERLDIMKPASVYLRYITGLTGEPMSASKPETSVFLSDDEETIKRKVWMALTGGRPTLKEQRELGGEPDKCVVFEWLGAFVYEDDEKLRKHREACLSGELVCGECKRLLAEELIRKLREHRQRRARLLERIHKYFLHEIDLDELHLDQG